MKGFGLNKPKKKEVRSIDINRRTSANKLKEAILNQNSYGNILSAEKLCKSFLKLGILDLEILEIYVQICKTQGRENEINLLLRKAILNNPKSCNLYVFYATFLIQAGKLDIAENLLLKSISIEPNHADSYSKLGLIMQIKGKLIESVKIITKAIQINPVSAGDYLNLGASWMSLQKIDKAEECTLKAISLRENDQKAHLNLGYILLTKGELASAEKSFLKVLELGGNIGKAFSALSNFENYHNNTEFLKKLFSLKLNDLSIDQKIEISYARSNILHKKHAYSDSAKYLNYANSLKLKLYPSSAEDCISQATEYSKKSKQLKMEKILSPIKTNTIFIVGMPRSGSTLLESILSMNPQVEGLGETEILDTCFKEYEKLNKDDRKCVPYQMYIEKINQITKKENITTDKRLFNYIYSAFIATQFQSSKIIHCYRNPLDNILSIYRANFSEGLQYSSSLKDIAKVLINQDMIMSEYKSRFPSEIYDLNYDNLVLSPKEVISSIVDWLGWEWNEAYISPHLNNRKITTASNIQVRSPINGNSVGKWKEYKEMLRPAIEELIKYEKFQSLEEILR